MSFVASAFAVVAGAFAADLSTTSKRPYSEEDQWSFGFWGDFYTNKSLEHLSPGSTIFGRKYDIHNKNFQLSGAGVDIRRAPSKDLPIGFTLDLIAGDQAEIRNRFEPGGSHKQYFAQMFVDYGPADGKWSIGYGKFNTWMGYEVDKTGDNINYSHGFVNTFTQPTYHNGGWFKANLSNNFDIGLYGVNGWNEVDDSNDDMSFGAHLGFKGNNWKARLNFFSGREGNDATGGGLSFFTCDATAIDGHVEFNVNNRLKLAAAGTWVTVEDDDSDNEAKWHGVAGYLQYKMAEKWTLGARFEQFVDEDGFRLFTILDGKGGGPGEITLDSTTITIDYATSEKSKLRLEWRKDNFDADLGGGSDGIGSSFDQKTWSISWWIRL